MAEYWEDWSASTLEAEPTGWTKRWNFANTTYSVVADATSPTGRVLRVTKGGSAERAAISMDSVDADADRATIKVRALIRMPEPAGAGSYIGVAGRGAGAASTETSCHAAFGRKAGGARELRTWDYSGGSATSITANGTDAWQVGAWVWVGIDLSGTARTATARAITDPATAVATANPTTAVTAAGWAGIWSFASANTIDIAAFSVATDTDAVNYSDGVAPALTSATGTETGSTTAALSVSTDVPNGTLYWVVTGSATPPSVAQIQAGQDHTGAAAVDSGNQAVTATGAQNANATGLTAETTYYAHFQHRDQLLDESTVATSASFTTDAAAAVRLEIDDLLYVDAEKSALVTDTGYEVYVLDPSDNTLSKYFASVNITSGIVQITDALYETPTDTFEVVLIKGNIRGVFPATVVNT